MIAYIEGKNYQGSAVDTTVETLDYVYYFSVFDIHTLYYFSLCV